MKIITLHKNAQSWLSTSDDQETFDLFGTYTIPTAFTAAADWQTVYSKIRHLNPTAAIYIRVNGKTLADKFTRENGTIANNLLG